MIADNIDASKVALRELSVEDSSEAYVTWLNDVEINKYLDPFESKHTLESVRMYIQEKKQSKNEYLYGIFYENIHVGNIKIDFNYAFKNGKIGYIVGEKKYWGKGIATAAIKIILSMCKEMGEIRKISAGVYEGNIASEKVLFKCGLDKEGVRKKHIFVNNEMLDYYEFGIIL
jgi:[ribosomal protein S5]-alanine N-acetyltransferase